MQLRCQIASLRAAQLEKVGIEYHLRCRNRDGVCSMPSEFFVSGCDSCLNGVAVARHDEAAAMPLQRRKIVQRVKKRIYIFKQATGVMLNFGPKMGSVKCVWLKVGATRSTYKSTHRTTHRNTYMRGTRTIPGSDFSTRTAGDSLFEGAGCVPVGPCLNV